MKIIFMVISGKDIQYIIENCLKKVLREMDMNSSKPYVLFKHNNMYAVTTRENWDNFCFDENAIQDVCNRNNFEYIEDALPFISKQTGIPQEQIDVN